MYGRILCVLSVLLSFDVNALRPFEREEEKTISQGEYTVFSYVDIPLSLDAWKAYADKNTISYQVEEGKIHSGATACAHSPICALVVPLALLGSLSDSNKRYIVNTTIDTYSVSISYHHQSKHFLGASIDHLDGNVSVKTQQFSELKTAYLYYEDKQALIEDRVAQLVRNHFSHAYDERRSEALVAEVRYFYADMDDYVTDFLLENTFRGRPRALFIKKACHQVLEEKYRGLLRKINQTIDSASAFALISCLEDKGFLSERSQEEKESARLSFKQFCLHSKKQGVVHVETFKRIRRVFQGSEDRLQRLVDQCEYKDLKLLWEYAAHSALGKDAFIYLYQKDDSYKTFLSHSVTTAAKNNQNIIRAKIALTLSGEYYGSGFYPDAFSNINEEMLGDLVSLYFADLRDETVNFLGRYDPDIKKQAILLPYFYGMGEDHKKLALKHVSSVDREDDVQKLAMYYVLGFQPSFEMEQNVLYRKGASLSMPEEVSDVSEKVSSEGEASTDLAYFSMKVSGMAPEDIQLKFEEINGRPATSVDKIKRLLPF